VASYFQGLCLYYFGGIHTLSQLSGSNFLRILFGDALFMRRYHSICKKTNYSQPLYELQKLGSLLSFTNIYPLSYRSNLYMFRLIFGQRFKGILPEYFSKSMSLCGTLSKVFGLTNFVLTLQFTILWSLSFQFGRISRLCMDFSSLHFNQETASSQLT
jgi:hypothetical protein